MKRIIKFRAWDKEGRRMVFVECLYRDGSVVYIQEHYQGEQEPAISEETLMPDGCVPMQFTGLTDKNGKEIYEGDIGRFGGDNAPYEVIWSGSGFFFRYRDDLAKVLHQVHVLNKQFEVIGNIFSNPELLNNDSK